MQLQDIAGQIREKHLQTVATSGGHLGSGLGVVELTLGLYQTLDFECDKVIWDVGHQAYPHKLITGRYEQFHTLRQKNGIAGYLKRCENQFDYFGAGHASTSISAALGVVLQKLFKDRASLSISSRSRSNSENLRHEFYLSSNVAFFDSLNLSFANHVHRFVASQGSPRCVK